MVLCFVEHSFISRWCIVCVVLEFDQDVILFALCIARSFELVHSGIRRQCAIGHMAESGFPWFGCAVRSRDLL